MFAPGQHHMWQLTFQQPIARFYRCVACRPVQTACNSDRSIYSCSTSQASYHHQLLQLPHDMRLQVLTSKLQNTPCIGQGTVKPHDPIQDVSKDNTATVPASLTLVTQGLCQAHRSKEGGVVTPVCLSQITVAPIKFS